MYVTLVQHPARYEKDGARYVSALKRNLYKRNREQSQNNKKFEEAKERIV